MEQLATGIKLYVALECLRFGYTIGWDFYMFWQR